MAGNGVVTLIRRHTLKFNGLLYWALTWVPVPAQDKWNDSLHLLRLHIRLLNHLAAEERGREGAEALIAKSLHRAGRKWVEKRFIWSTPTPSRTQMVRDTCSVIAKTLNLPSVATAGGEVVTVTTFFCPFLDDAVRSGEDRATSCQRICGEHSSLFKGVSEGFPFFIRYQAPKMMGQGDPMCVKELELRRQAPTPGTDPSSNSRRNGV